MALTGAEGLLGELHDYLGGTADQAAQLPVKLRALELEYDDGLALTPPHRYVRADPTRRAISDPPVIFMKVTGDRLPHWGETYSLSTQDVIIWAFLRAADPEDIAKLQYRYGRALWESIVEGHFGANPAITWEPGIDAEPERDYSPSVQRETETLAAVALGIRFAKQESE